MNACTCGRNIFHRARIQLLTKADINKGTHKKEKNGCKLSIYIYRAHVYYDALTVCLPLPGNQVRLRQARQATVFLACRLTCPLVLLLCFSHHHYRFFLFKNITTINLRNACEDGIHTCRIKHRFVTRIILFNHTMTQAAHKRQIQYICHLTDLPERN